MNFNMKMESCAELMDYFKFLYSRYHYGLSEGPGVDCGGFLVQCQMEMCSSMPDSSTTQRGSLV